MNDNIRVEETPNNQLTDLQVYGISSSIVTLIGYLKKYILLTQMLQELKNKSLQIQSLMREIYQFKETELIMDIRSQFDMVYVYTRDKTIINNFMMIRERFEQSIDYLTSNMLKINNIQDKNYNEILDEFCDKLKHLTDIVMTKSIFDENFKIV